MKKPAIFATPLEVLSPREKNELRSFMQGKTYLKLLSIVESLKPSSNCSKAGSGERDAFSDGRATARLGEIRGWDLHTTALYMALATPRKIKEFVEETYPDSGRMDHDPATETQK